MAVHVDINWIFKCHPKSISLNVSGRSLRERCLNLYKQPIIIDGNVVSSAKKWNRPCVYLLDDFPSDKHEQNPENDVIFVKESSSEYNSKTETKIVKVKVEKPRTKIVGRILSSASAVLQGSRTDISYLKRDSDKIKYTAERSFLGNLQLIGQFDKKCIVAKEERDRETLIWLFDQHACHERINLERILGDKSISREDANMKACKSSVRFGDVLTEDVQCEIIRELAKCKEPFHCAHGRPTCWLIATLRKS